MSGASTPGNAAIVIAATFTAEPLLPSLRFVLDETGLAFDVRFSPYNQLFQELLSSGSLLATNTGGIDVVLVRVEDFVREIENVQEALAVIERTTAELSKALSHHALRANVPTVVAVLRPSPRAARALLPGLETANAALEAHARTLPGISLVSRQDIELVSVEERYDQLGDELAHIPFTEQHYASIALAIVRKVHALRVPAHKVLVLDCDETLWRGVVGEDGIDGLTISPGLARLQQFAVDAQRKGTLICLLSKNAERDVLEVFEKRSDMILKIEHIAAHRINWEPKPRNIASIARALNLGLDSFVFIDDNPVECALMRAELPDVVTLQLPADDAIESFLSHLWTFDKVVVTDEDARRTSMYRENAARQELEESASDIAEFIASLGVVIDIAPPAASEWPRVAQLTQRTNQFNFTTIRRTESEMRALPSSGSTVLRVNVRDRFGDYGLVGLVIVDETADSLVVDTLLLSCRVLGRGVEHTILRRLGEMAKQRALHSVDLPLLTTSKNEPARAFADSVAADFRREEQNRIVYRIPVENACAIAHRPGHDPAAVIDALKSEERKARPSSVLGSSVGRSERYVKLSQSLTSGRRVHDAVHAVRKVPRPIGGKAQAAVTATERGMLALWQEVLGIDGLGVDDDYFALGGTSLMAARLFAEIARRFGMKLPLTTILASPTVRALSSHLDQQRAPGSQTLIELKRGGPRSLFLVHDGDGETLLYLNMARLMPDDLAVFGIEPRRIAGVPLAHASIEDMAAFYVEEVRRQQPHGPYLLGGMCAGGVIAYEMASQLVGAGESVEFVALLDAAAPNATKKMGRIAKQRIGRLKQALADAAGQRSLVRRTQAVVVAVSRRLANALFWEIRQRATQLSVRARFSLLGELLRRNLSWPKFVPELSVRQIYDSAEARYTPKPLAISAVVLVRARTGEGGDTPYRHIYADETFGWDAVAHDLAVVDVDGGHSSMLQEPFVETLADALAQFLRRKDATTVGIRPVEAA